MTPQAENKICQSVGTRPTWKMQSWLENTSVAFAICIVQQLRSRYRLYVVGGRLHSTVCMHSTVSMARCGLRDAFVWLCKSETVEDHVLYYATVVSRCTSQAMSLHAAVLRDVLLVKTVTAGKCNWRHSGWSVRLVGFPQCYPACRFLTNKMILFVRNRQAG